MVWKLVSNGLWKEPFCCTLDRDYIGAEWEEICYYQDVCYDQMDDSKPGGMLGL